MTFLAGDAFQWAVNERKQYDADIAVGLTPWRPLVHLLNFEFEYRKPVYGRQINDVAFEFGRTLECIVLKDYLIRDKDID
ncbi:hypothetical protein BGX24_012493 [Mortierella sp. AD032]|nr:hypothetical protein BGX24_012493 [Mortierella sp. AD032]